jgi:hypothetical protein
MRHCWIIRQWPDKVPGALSRLVADCQPLPQGWQSRNLFLRQAFAALSRNSCDMAVGCTPVTPFAVAVR